MHTTQNTSRRSLRTIRLSLPWALSAVWALSLMPSLSQAQTAAAPAPQAYPSKPIKAIVPFAAGSATDQIGRAFAQKMSESLGQPIVIENKPGVNGMLGADAAAKSAPDGYTLLIGTNSTNAALKSLMKKLPYDQDTAFAPVAFLGQVPLIVGINNDVPAKTLPELIAMAKAKPGQMSFASASTSQRVSSEMLFSMAGVQLNYVPYKSGPAAMTDLIGGQVNLFTADLAVMLPQVKAGKVRGLAITTDKRSSVAPTSPTVAEQGYAGFDVSSWQGIVVPAGTPKPIVQRLHRDLSKVLASADIQERFAQYSAVPGSGSPEQFGQYIRQEIARWQGVAKAAGVKPE